MPFDGTFIYKSVEEYAPLIIGARADKIHQPSLGVLVFFLRGKDGNRRLIIDLSARPCVYISRTSPENPAVPLRFCTVLRKHLSGARVTAISSEGFERVIRIDFDTFNEMGDSISLSLFLELISASANAVLVKDGRIIDSLRRSDIESGARLVQPGAMYRPPTPMNKLDPLSTSAEELAKAVLSHGGELHKAVLDCVAGVSPAVANEIAAWASEDPTVVTEELDGAECRLISAFKRFGAALTAPPRPTLIKKDGKPRDFCWLPLSLSRDDCEQIAYPSLGELCEAFFKESQQRESTASKSSDLSRQLTSIRTRLLRKKAARENDLKKCADADDLRIYGELIKANIHSIEKGAAFADLVNYYDENSATVRVKLDPALSPADNAAKYFKDYKKRMSARGMLGGLIEQAESEIDYIESVEEALSRAVTASELDEIRDELTASGYIKAKAGEKRKKAVSGPMKYRTPSGFTVLVGRNNLENDRLTLRDADKNDIWFHTKDIHGSHVVIVCNGKTPDEQSLVTAAKLAAYHSKARNSSGVPVDSTLVRYVKKPSGARPGMVIYTNQRTVFVTPSPCEELRIN